MAPLTLQRVRTADAPAPLRRIILDLCNEAFGAPFEALFDLLPPDATHILAWREHSILVGHAVLSPRIFHAGRQALRTAYVDAVATLPALQRCGIGGAVLREALCCAADDAMDLAALSTYRPDWYARFGFVAWPGLLLVEREGNATPCPPEEGAVVMTFALNPGRKWGNDCPLTADWRPGGGW